MTSTTTQNWLERVRANADDLRYLVAYYHPCVSPETRMRAVYTPITAAAPEAACAVVRHDIVAQNPNLDPVAAFDAALARGEAGKVMLLLDEAWFGVPESISCWQIRGFREAVDLLDDPPDQDMEPF